MNVGVVGEFRAPAGDQSPAGRRGVNIAGRRAGEQGAVTEQRRELWKQRGKPGGGSSLSANIGLDNLSTP